MKLRADELAELSGGRLIYGSRDNTALDIKTDSREAGRAARAISHRDE